MHLSNVFIQCIYLTYSFNVFLMHLFNVGPSYLSSSSYCEPTCLPRPCLPRRPVPPGSSSSSPVDPRAPGPAEGLEAPSF